jgi:opacity protein-like surface antigen
VGLKTKANVMSLMVNGYVDLFDLGAAKVFAGGGIGMAQVKEKTKTSVAGTTVFEEKSKRSNNFAYQVTVGTSAQLTDGVTAELSYRWSDFGRVKKYKNINAKGLRYRGHNVIAGVRFDI